MVLPASGQLTTAQILAEFNQTGEFVTSSYYRGGGIVPATSGVTGGVAEVQTVGFSGATANTVTGGQDETVTIALDDRFSAGLSVDAATWQATISFDDANLPTTFFYTGTRSVPGTSEQTVTVTASSGDVPSTNLSNPDRQFLLSAGTQLETKNAFMRFIVGIFGFNALETAPRTAFSVDFDDVNSTFTLTSTFQQEIPAWIENLTSVTLSQVQSAGSDVLSHGTVSLSTVVNRRGTATPDGTHITDISHQRTTTTYDNATTRVEVRLTAGPGVPTGGVLLASGNIPYPNGTSDQSPHSILAAREYGFPVEFIHPEIFTSRTDPEVFRGESVTASTASSLNSTGYCSLAGGFSFWARRRRFNIDSAFAITIETRILDSDGTLLDSYTDSTFTSGTPTPHLLGPAEYNFTLDSSGAVFAGSISGTFASGANATTALTAIGSAVTTMFPTVTASAVTAITDFPTGDSSYTFDFNNLETPDGTAIEYPFASAGIPTVTVGSDSIAVLNASYDTAADFAADFASVGGPDGWVITSDGSVLTVIAPTAASGEVLVAQVVDGNVIRYDLIDNNPTQVLAAGQSITLDTNQNADIAQMLTITANDGTRTVPNITAIHGAAPAGTASSYTITDYDNMQVGVGTATSAETLSSALSRMATAINLNQETPIDFRGAVDGSNLVLTAQSVGSLNPGMPSTSLWSITVDHSTGDGDIAVTGVTRTTRGRDTLSNINPNVPDGSQGNTEITLPDDFHGATFGDN